MSQLAQVAINLIMRYDNLDELSTLTDSLNLQRGKTFSEGESADQINQVFHDSRVLANAANETLDIHDGSLTNKVGEDITLDILKILYIKNNSTDATMSIGAAATVQLAIFGAPANDLLLIPPLGEFLYLAPNLAGLDCSTNCKLKIAQGAGSSHPDYDIIIAGVVST